MHFFFTKTFFNIAGIACFAVAAVSTAQSAAPPEIPTQQWPWMSKALSPDQRADLVIRQMTLDEKLDLVHGTGWNGLRKNASIPKGSLGGAGYVEGVPRLGIPGINMADSAVGVRLSGAGSHYATLLPSVLGAASSWDPNALFVFGDVIGRELRDTGYNMSIGGGVDLARDPRNGRNFEYAGEDPLLAGTMVGNLAKGVQSNQVMGDVKHYAFNDQETGRAIYNAEITQRAARESDLLAFQIAIQMAHPAGVMCSYNKETITPPNTNPEWSCQNDYLLNQVLKKDWGFQGFVLSDWSGTHSSVHAFMSGLDQEQPGSIYFGEPLKKAVEDGEVPMARLDDAVHRVLRSMFANGVIDNPPQTEEVNPFLGRRDAEHIADESMVLLRNKDQVLPLSSENVHSIALIGAHADVAVLSGGGSAQVDAPGGGAVNPHPGSAHWMEHVWFPSSPELNIHRHDPSADIQFNDGADVESAASLAAKSQIAIVFVTQWMSEGMDRPTLELPDNQDKLIEAVAKANRHTIVIIESGGPVAMPWIDQVQAVIEAWFPGIGGAQSLANILFGDVDPSGRLPITFPKSAAQLPRPLIPGLISESGPGHAPRAARHGPVPFNVDYNIEGARVGYKWFESKHETPLFPFGYGLSYTTFAFSALKVDATRRVAALTVRNTGMRAGTEVAQVYAILPANSGESTYKRLVGWDRVSLAPGEAKSITIGMNPLTLSIFDVAKNSFVIVPGNYTILAGGSSADTPLRIDVPLE